MDLKQVKLVSLIFASILLSNASVQAQNNYNEKQIEVSLRMIGHQVLLGSGDSSSRVLPIRKEDDQYRVEFESAFEFNPEKLVEIVRRVVKETKLAQGYIVEVENDRGEVVYSYEIKDRVEADVIPCRERSQPKEKYSLLFSLAKKVAPKTEVLKASSTSRHSIYYIITTLILVLTSTLLFFLWRRLKKPVLNPNLIQIGKYHFDKQQAVLFIDQQKIELTSKENDLLVLLYEMVNKTIEREVLLKEVWGDEGDYVGRTLDVFISKLRKKLEVDAAVKIVNIRGVGYKLVVG